MFFQKRSYQLAKKYSQIFVHIIKILRFGKREVAKEKFNAAKKLVEIWDVNVENIVISKLLKTKTNSKYFIGIKFDKAISPLVLVMPKMSEYVKVFQVKEGN